MVEVSHLTKRYGGHTALLDVSFRVPEGRITGLLGPNGAGKSTTMNLMTGCLAPSGGTVTIDGKDILEEPRETKRCLGYLPEVPPVYPDRTPEEYLRFVARAKGILQVSQELDRVMELTEITQVRDRLICNLSKGYRQRVGLAQALLGDPRLLILDEPTAGLDPLQITQIRALIRQLGKDRTVILSSHIWPEVQAVCDHILILSRGRLVAQGSPQELQALGSGGVLMLEAECTPQQAQALLEGLSNCTYSIQSQGKRLTLRLETPGENLENLSRQLFFRFARAQVPILRMNPEKASLEDLFLELTGKENQ